MAEDKKFTFENGKFVNRVSGEAIPDDEPVILFRARDRHALQVLEYYLTLVTDDHHEQAVQDRIGEFRAFKLANIHRMKEPGITQHIELNSDKQRCRFPTCNGHYQAQVRGRNMCTGCQDILMDSELAALNSDATAPQPEFVEGMRIRTPEGWGTIVPVAPLGIMARTGQALHSDGRGQEPI